MAFFNTQRDADLEDDFVLAAEVEPCASVLALRRLGVDENCIVLPEF